MKIIWTLALMLFCAILVQGIATLFFFELGMSRHDNYQYYFYKSPVGTLVVAALGVIAFLTPGVVAWRSSRQNSSALFLSAACGFFIAILILIITPWLMGGIDGPAHYLLLILFSVIIGVVVAYAVKRIPR